MWYKKIITNTSPLPISGGFVKALKILFVSPRNSEPTFWGFQRALKFVGKKAPMPNLGLLTVASYFKDWERRFIDLNIGPLNVFDIMWADLVAIGGMKVHEPSVREIVRMCKSYGKKILGGGPLFTAEPHLFPEVDHLVLGEVESGNLVEFIREFKAGVARHLYEAPVEKPSLALTPQPAWELLVDKLQYYHVMPLQFSRGCPHHCIFCDITQLFGTKPRQKSIPQFLAELDALYQAGWRGQVFIVDDNFIGNIAAAKDMLRAIMGWLNLYNYPFTLSTEVDVRVGKDDELLNLFSLANFDELFFGIETVYEPTLRWYRKHHNLGVQLAELMQRCLNHGIVPVSGFIVGADTDDPGAFEKIRRFIQDVGMVKPMLGLLQAPPGTALYKFMAEQGRLLAVSFGNNTSAAMNFVPKMNAEELHKLYAKLVQEIFSPQAYFKRAELFLERYRSRAVTHVQKEHLIAIWKSFWLIGVFSEDRGYFWRMVLVSARNGFRNFSKAISLCIQWQDLKRLPESI